MAELLYNFQALKPMASKISRPEMDIQCRSMRMILYLVIVQLSKCWNCSHTEGVAEGTYYYVLTIPGKEDLTGSITLVR